MDFYKEFDKVDKRLSIRDKQEIQNITRKDDQYKLPYRSVVKRAQGEYFATVNDRLRVIKFIFIYF